MRNKTLAQASKEANDLRHDYSDLDVEIARNVNRLALLMNGDRTAAAMALMSHELWRLNDYFEDFIDGAQSISVRGGAK